MIIRFIAFIIYIFYFINVPFFLRIGIKEIIIIIINIAIMDFGDDLPCGGY